MALRLWLAACAAPLMAAACAFTPPPVSLGHDLPPANASARNHVTAGLTAAHSPEWNAEWWPLHAAYVRRVGDDLYVGASQSFEPTVSYPQTRIFAAVDTGEFWMPHAGFGAGFLDTLRQIYATAEFGVRLCADFAAADLYADPVVAFSVPFLEALGRARPYGFALLNAGAEIPLSDRVRVSFGPTWGWAQHLGGGRSFPLFAASAAATFSF